MSNALTRSLGAFLICTTSSVLLFSCNSKQEKVTRPIDPEVPALYAETEHTEDERKEIMQDAVADLRAADAEADLELERIKARAVQRKLAYKKEQAEAAKLTPEQARKEFKGTEFSSLSLDNGGTYQRVTVLKADDIGVTISHRDGARRIKYADLPKSIQERCQYSARL